MPRVATAVAVCLAAAGVAFSPTGAQAMTLADVLVNAPDTTPFSFETLIAALSAAGLVDTFADPTSGPFTVFPPTDDAFAAALEALGITAGDLLADVDVSLAARAVNSYWRGLRTRTRASHCARPPRPRGPPNASARDLAARARAEALTLAPPLRARHRTPRPAAARVGAGDPPTRRPSPRS